VHTLRTLPLTHNAWTSTIPLSGRCGPLCRSKHQDFSAICDQPLSTETTFGILEHWRLSLDHHAYSASSHPKHSCASSICDLRSVTNKNQSHCTRHPIRPNNVCSYHAAAKLVSVILDQLNVVANASEQQSRPAGLPRRRSISLRKKVESEVTIKDLIIKGLQEQRNISKTQAEILRTQHINYHALLEITENMQHTISRIETVKEDVQVSDKIAFAAGFGCGLLVLLGIWLSPFGGKDKDDDGEK
jgi:hypothetical protein